MLWKKPVLLYYVLTDVTFILSLFTYMHSSLNVKNTIKILDNPETSLQILIDLGFDLQQRLKLNLETEIDDINSNQNIHIATTLKNQAVTAINAVNNSSIQKILSTFPESSLSKFAELIEQWIQSGKLKPLNLKQTLSKELKLLKSNNANSKKNNTSGFFNSECNNLHTPVTLEQIFNMWKDSQSPWSTTDDLVYIHNNWREMLLNLMLKYDIPDSMFFYLVEEVIVPMSEHTDTPNESPRVYLEAKIQSFVENTMADMIARKEKSKQVWCNKIEKLNKWSCYGCTFDNCIDDRVCQACGRYMNPFIDAKLTKSESFGVVFPFGLRLIYFGNVWSTVFKQLVLLFLFCVSSCVFIDSA